MDLIESVVGGRGGLDDLDLGGALAPGFRVKPRGHSAGPVFLNKVFLRHLNIAILCPLFHFKFSSKIPVSAFNNQLRRSDKDDDIAIKEEEEEEDNSVLFAKANAEQKLPLVRML